MMSTKELTEKTESKTDEPIDKEIMALIQIVNGLNEVENDDVSFSRVYEYIKIRYGERERRKNDVYHSTVAFCVMLSDCLQTTQSTLVDVRRLLATHPEMQPDVLISKLDAALKQIDMTFKEKTFGELDAYKVYKEVMKESA